MSIYSKDEVIQYHVQVWRPLIIKMVDAKTLASCMCPDFITSEQKIQIMQIPLKSEATEFLLDILEYSTVRGKWTSFLQALEENNYPHLLSVLKGDADRENGKLELQRRLIEIFAAEIEKEIDANIIARYLLPSGTLQMIDIEIIQSNNERYGRTFGVQKLLELVPTRVTGWFDIFLEVLYCNGHESLVLRIDDTYEKKYDVVSGSISFRSQFSMDYEFNEIDEDVFEKTCNVQEADIPIDLQMEETTIKKPCKNHKTKNFLKRFFSPKKTKK